jgi:hypothetical protein
MSYIIETYLEDITSIEERSLTTVWKADELHRLHWNTEGMEVPIEAVPMTSKGDQSLIVDLEPLHIKTYFVEFMQV